MNLFTPIYDSIKRHIGVPEHVMEVGVWTIGDSRGMHYSRNPRTIVELVEPQRARFNAIERQIRNKQNIKTHNVAIYMKDGELELLIPKDSEFGGCASASAFIGESGNSPFLANHTWTDGSFIKETVQGITFDKIDNGAIDVLFVDAEGSEWCVLKNMISRPKAICLEMQWKGYKTNHYDQVKEWLKTNQYTESLVVGGDVLFYKDGY